MQNIIFEKPYKFVPPHRGNFLPSFIQTFRLTDLYMSRCGGVDSYEIRNAERLQETLRSGAGVLLAPNHCRYADAHANRGPDGRRQALADRGAGHDQGDAGDDGAGRVVQNGRCQALLFPTAMEVATPRDERRPDGKHAAERPKEEIGCDRAKHTNANGKCCIRGHLTPLSCKSGRMRRKAGGPPAQWSGAIFMPERFGSRGNDSPKRAQTEQRLRDLPNG